MSGYFTPQDDYEDFGPSKTDQKKSSDRLQVLGERLAEMSEAQLKKLPLEDALLKALLDFKRIKAHEAIRRQRQYIGKLMRQADEPALLAALNPLRNPALQRQLDLLLARLISHGDELLGEVMTRFPAADRHTLRTLVRLARKEVASTEAAGITDINETSHPARHKLWIYLRELAALAM